MSKQRQANPSKLEQTQANLRKPKQTKVQPCWTSPPSIASFATCRLRTFSWDQHLQCSTYRHKHYDEKPPSSTVPFAGSVFSTPREGLTFALVLSLRSSPERQHIAGTPWHGTDPGPRRFMPWTARPGTENPGKARHGKKWHGVARKVWIFGENTVWIRGHTSSGILTSIFVDV